MEATNAHSHQHKSQPKKNVLMGQSNTKIQVKSICFTGDWLYTTFVYIHSKDNTAALSQESQSKYT